MKLLFSIKPNQTVVEPLRWNASICRRRCSSVEWKLKNLSIRDIQFKGSSPSNLGNSNFIDFKNGDESRGTGVISGWGVV